jgi:hypothetical protein
MDQIGFNPQAQGLVIGNMQGADMGCATSPNAWPSVMASKAITSDPSAKVVCLTHINLSPPSVVGKLAEDINAGARFVARTDVVNLKVVFCSTSAPPANDGR